MKPIFLVVLLLVLIGSWPYSRIWGHYPSAVAALISLVIVIMLLAGRRRRAGS